MFTFIAALLLLVAGYLLYGRLTERIFAPDGRDTPAVTMEDGVDFVRLKTWKALLIQFLNIAGTGPIFGALMGAVFGPVVLLWIVFGSILGGAVHDYLSGMISCRHNGASVAELSGLYLGKAAKWALRIFMIIILILAGSVFVSSPAALLARLTPEVLDKNFWVVVILVYYFVATLLPIDKIIGRLYPIFGAVLFVMAVSIVCGIAFNADYSLPELTLRNLHPDGLPVFPYMFITVACGAVSGFHATQSPMIAKCIVGERTGRPVFYGSMIIEAVVALIWASAGAAFYGTTGALGEALSTLGQSGVVYEISIELLGIVGGSLAIVGVVVCPLTTGDTTFRSARLLIAEVFGLEQKSFKNRILITAPLLAVGALLTQLNFDVLWRYFASGNQTLGMITLWVVTSYLLKNCRNKLGSLISALPATFMTAVCVTYIMAAEEGFGIPLGISYIVGACSAAALLSVYAVFLAKAVRAQKSEAPSE